MLLQFLGQLPSAFTGPFQRRLRVPARGGLHEAFQSLQQLGGFLFRCFAPTPRLPLSPLRPADPRPQFSHPSADSTVGKACRLSDDCNSSTPQRPRFHCCPAPPPSFVQVTDQALIFGTKPLHNCLIPHPFSFAGLRLSLSISVAVTCFLPGP